MNSRKLIVGALALAGVLSVGLAQARDHNDVQWSVTIGAPLGVPVYTQPYPVYSQPYPAYVQPQPVYTQPYPVYSQPYPQLAPRHYPQRQYRPPTRWDHDGDGIPNRYDRLYNPYWDRNGDGVPNRHDRDHRRDHTRWDLGGSDLTYWQDRNSDYFGRGR